MELRGVKVGLARALAAAGYDRFSVIASADPAQLVAAVKRMTYEKAEQVVSVAKEKLQDRAEEMLLAMCFFFLFLFLLSCFGFRLLPP